MKGLPFCLLILVSCQKQPTTLLEPGDYLNTRYTERVLVTRSPLAAEGPKTELEMYTVQKQKDGLIVTQIGDFHSGALTFEILPNGKVYNDWNPPETYPKIVFTDREHFNIMWPTRSGDASKEEFGDGAFAWVGDADAWAYRKLIAGTYKTQDGVQVVFEPNGIGQLPDGVRRYYKVGLDHVLVDFDYLYGQGKTYGFRFDKRDLLIFDVIENEDFPDGSLAPNVKWRLTPLIR